MFPTKWHHRHEHNVHSLFRCEESDVYRLPAVGSSGELCSTIFSHRLMSVFSDKFYALQNGLPNGSKRHRRQLPGCLGLARLAIVPEELALPPAASGATFRHRV